MSSFPDVIPEALRCITPGPSVSCVLLPHVAAQRFVSMLGLVGCDMFLFATGTLSSSRHTHGRSSCDNPQHGSSTVIRCRAHPTLARAAARRHTEAVCGTAPTTWAPDLHRRHHRILDASQTTSRRGSTEYIVPTLCADVASKFDSYQNLGCTFRCSAMLCSCKEAAGNELQWCAAHHNADI